MDSTPVGLIAKSAGILFCLLAVLRLLAANADAADLRLTRHRGESGSVSSGHLIVYEDREAETGRKLHLDVVVLHATGAAAKPDPIFYLAGGPGAAAAAHWKQLSRSPMRKDRDIVLMSQRGTGGSNRLLLPTQVDVKPEDLLKPIIRSEGIDEAIKRLSMKADLRLYSTPLAMDDLDELREALGYRRVNLVGGSYGTRAALVYIRRHGPSVRTAILNGVAPLTFTNPLFHSQSAQLALDKLFDEVESKREYRAAFPDIRQRFEEILERLDESPAKVRVRLEGANQILDLSLDRKSFCSSLRYQLYYLNTQRRVPLLLTKAWEGDFEPFVLSSVKRNARLSSSIALGMLLCVIAAEDIDRIDPSQIESLTTATFAGDAQVRAEIEACRDWPRSQLPEDFGEPVQSDVPVLILSGEFDPVTPPRWGQIVADNFPNSLHVVAPDAHGVRGPCIDAISLQFLDRGSVAGVDVSCVDQIKLRPLETR